MQHIQNDSKKCTQENLVTGLFRKMPLYSFIERGPKLNLVKIVLIWLHWGFSSNQTKRVPLSPWFVILWFHQ